MQSSLHKLVEDVFDEQEMALVLNLALVNISNVENAVALQSHMKSFNGGWGQPLKRIEAMREQLKALLVLADHSQNFSFKVIANDDTLASEGKFHNDIIRFETKQDGKVQR